MEGAAVAAAGLASSSSSIPFQPGMIAPSPHMSLNEAGRYLLDRFSTGNRVIDLCLGGIVFVLMMRLTDSNRSTDIMSMLGEGITWLLDWLFRRNRKGEIEYCIEEVDMVANCFTPTYRAIMYKLGCLKDHRVWRFREKYLDYYDDSECKSVTESLYQVLQKEPIHVTDDVWIKCEESEEARPNTSGTQTMQINTYCVRVYSTTLTAHQIKEVVNGWVKEYKDFKRLQLKDKQLMFMVRFSGKKTDGNHFGEETEEEIHQTFFKSFRTFDNLFFERKEEILDDINFFLHDKEWHQKRGLPDSLGILCYGSPGCGKTSFIKALLKHTNRHGVIFSVNRFTRLESIESLMRSDIINDYPIPQDQRIYILEDIDAMGDLVHKRKAPTAEPDTAADDEDDEGQQNNKAAQRKGFPSEDELFEKQLFKWLKFGLQKSSEHHLGFLLNLLDGLVETPGRIVVMTTNHIKKLDPALIRPGRIDINIEFVKCTRHIMKQILSHFFEKDESKWELPDCVIDYELSPAEVTQFCRANKHDFEGALFSIKSYFQAKAQLLRDEAAAEAEALVKSANRLHSPQKTVGRKSANKRKSSRRPGRPSGGSVAGASAGGDGSGKESEMRSNKGEEDCVTKSSEQEGTPSASQSGAGSETPSRDSPSSQIKEEELMGEEKNQKAVDSHAAAAFPLKLAHPIPALKGAKIEDATPQSTVSSLQGRFSEGATPMTNCSPMTQNAG